MTGALAPNPWFTGLDDTGVTLPGAKLFTYLSGTSTKANTYLLADLSVPNTNPIILDAAGRAVIYLAADTSYKFVLAPANDTDPPTSPIKTIDPVTSVPLSAGQVDIQGTVGESLSANTVVFLSSGLNGLTAGKWYKTSLALADSSHGALAVGILLAFASIDTTSTIRLLGRVTGLVGLTTGLPYYANTAGGLTATAPGNSRPIGVSDSTTSLVIGGERDNDVIRVASFTAAVSNVGAGEDTLASYTAGIQALYLDGMAFEGTFFGLTANNANAKQLRLRALDGVANNLVADFALTANEAGQWRVDFTIMRISGTTMSSIAHTAVGPTNGPTSRIGTTVLQGSNWNTLAAVEIRLTGEGVNNDDIRMVGGVIKRVNFGH